MQSSSQDFLGNCFHTMMNRNALLRLVSGVSLGIVGSTLMTYSPAQAEGSRSLYPPGTTGNRANIEWRTSTYSGLLRRRTLLKVYANAGEYILLGSSAVGVASGATSGNVQVYNPGTVTGTIGQEIIPGVANFSCTDQRTATGNASQGQITTRATELAGPDTITNPATATPGGAVPNGYVPCYYQAPSTGIYSVVFSGPAGTNADTETAPSGSIATLQTGANQNTSIAAWDVTVRDSLTSTTDIRGRLFTNYLAQFAGGNNRPLNSTLLTVTTDGFRYRTDLGGIDPNGFIFYANNVGFYDSDGQTPLYRDLVSSTNQLANPQGGVTLAGPSHLIFFTNTDNVLYQPDNDAIAANFIPTIPTNPVLSSLTYQGSAGGINSFVSSGGVFTLQTNVNGNYEIIISRNGSDFDPTNVNNRVLRGIRSAGTSTVTWDGLDNSGAPFPVGSYQSRARISNGEYHFPLLDVENSEGGPRYELLNSPTGNCNNMALGLCTSAYYDDRGYRTLNGTTVGTVNATLPDGNVPPNPNSAVTGFDTLSNNRAFGDNSSNGFGNTKGLDLWTFFPSAVQTTSVVVIAAPTQDLTIFKSHVGDFSVGSNGVYTIRVRNNGTVAIAAGETITVTDTLPTGLTFVSGVGTGWTCGAVGQDVTCTNTSGLAATTDSTITLTVAVDASVAATIANTATVSVTNPATNDVVTTNNVATDPTTVTGTGANPNLLIVKRITAINGDTTGFAAVQDDPNDTNDTNANWPNGFLVGGTTATASSGDVVDYTIYFLNTGNATAGNVKICDPLSTLLTYIPNSYDGSTPTDGGGTSNLGIELNFGGSSVFMTGANDAPDRGQLVAAGVAPTGCVIQDPNNAGAVIPMTAANNNNGTLVVDLTTVDNATGPGAPNTAYGYVRFRATVN